MKLTPHFAVHEFEHSDRAVEERLANVLPGDRYADAVAVCMVLEVLRARIGLPIVLNSGYRSGPVNALVGGSDSSDHRWARAADAEPEGADRRVLWEALVVLAPLLPFDQGIVYEDKSHVHIGVRRHTAPRRQLKVALEQRTPDGERVYIAWDVYRANTERLWRAA